MRRSPIAALALVAFLAASPAGVCLAMALDHSPMMDSSAGCDDGDRAISGALCATGSTTGAHLVASRSSIPDGIVVPPTPPIRLTLEASPLRAPSREDRSPRTRPPLYLVHATFLI